jgi:hypothetical protein
LPTIHSIPSKCCAAVGRSASAIALQKFDGSMSGPDGSLTRTCTWTPLDCTRKFHEYKGAQFSRHPPLSQAGPRTAAPERCRSSLLERCTRSAAKKPMLNDGPADGLKNKKPRKSLNLRGFLTAFGGDGGIRTLDPGFGPDAPLAGECLRPLGHVSQTFARTREAVRRERNNIGFRTARQFP